jgi:hypothetical protein
VTLLRSFNVSGVVCGPRLEFAAVERGGVKERKAEIKAVEREGREATSEMIERIFVGVSVRLRGPCPHITTDLMGFSA